MIICDGMPYYDVQFSGLPFLWTFLFNLGLFIGFAAIVFIVSGESGAFADWRHTIPYCICTVTLGVVVDLVFMYLVVFQDDYFAELVFQGGLVGHEHFIALLIGSLVTFILLWLVQMFLIHTSFSEIVLEKRMAMSAVISFITLPTWATLVLLALNGVGVTSLEQYV